MDTRNGYTISLPALDEIRRRLTTVIEQADGVDSEDSEWVQSALVTIAQAAGKALELLPEQGGGG